MIESTVCTESWKGLNRGMVEISLIILFIYSGMLTRYAINKLGRKKGSNHGNVISTY